MLFQTKRAETKADTSFSSRSLQLLMLKRAIWSSLSATENPGSYISLFIQHCINREMFQRYAFYKQLQSVAYEIHEVLQRKKRNLYAHFELSKKVSFK